MGIKIHSDIRLQFLVSRIFNRRLTFYVSFCCCCSIDVGLVYMKLVNLGTSKLMVVMMIYVYLLTQYLNSSPFLGTIWHCRVSDHQINVSVGHINPPRAH